MFWQISDNAGRAHSLHSGRAESLNSPVVGLQHAWRQEIALLRGAMACWESPVSPLRTSVHFLALRPSAYSAMNVFKHHEESIATLLLCGCFRETRQQQQQHSPQAPTPPPAAAATTSPRLARQVRQDGHGSCRRQRQRRCNAYGNRQRRW